MRLGQALHCTRDPLVRRLARSPEPLLYKLTIEGSLSWPIGARPLVIGRGAGSDVLLEDDAVSLQHATVRVEEGLVWVADLNSRNGTRLNGEPLVGACSAGLGALLCIGRTVLRIEPDGIPPAARVALALEDLGSGHAVAFTGARLRLGDSPNADVHVEGCAEAVLLRVGDEGLLLGIDDDTRPLVLGTPFSLGKGTFVVRLADRGLATTLNLNPVVVAPTLRATLSGGPGPGAWVRGEDGAEVAFASENRATLLWVLGRQLRDDRAAGLVGDRAGWVPEAEAMTAIWGRAAGGSAANLRVLVCRVRRDLREGGVDPWALEHRAGHLRGTFGAVEIED